MNIKNPSILSINATHERIPNHMVRPPAPDIDYVININQMSWSTNILYEWNFNVYISQQIEQMIDSMYIAYRSYVSSGKYGVVTWKILWFYLCFTKMVD